MNDGATVSRRRLLQITGGVAVSGAVGTAAVAAAGAGPAATALLSGSTAGKKLVHPGMLHTAADFARMRAKVRAGAQPWQAGWEKLKANPHSHLGWKANPSATVYRGSGSGENYRTLYNDTHAAYQNALRWRIRRSHAHGDVARDILNAWSATLTRLDGTADRFLAAGIYGYQLANAAELMRGYPGFDLARFKTMMLKVFYPLNHAFLTTHNGAYITNYWANWDLCNMASVLAIGILCDDRAKVTEAVRYFKYGKGMGSIKNVVPFLHPGGLGQWQEAGRDQGHATLGISLMGAFCEMAWNQGHDLYGYDDSRFLKGAEYIAKYNLGGSVPFTPYTWLRGAPGIWGGRTTQTVVSPAGRGMVRPGWALVYNHYVRRRGLHAPYSRAFAQKITPEGGGGDYGPNSGGYDQLGFGTLTATR